MKEETKEAPEKRDRRRKRPFSTPFCTHFPFFCLLTWESNTVRLSICEKYCLSIKGWAPCLQGTRSWRPSAIRTPAPALLVHRGDSPRLPLTTHHVAAVEEASRRGYSSCKKTDGVRRCWKLTSHYVHVTLTLESDECYVHLVPGVRWTFCNLFIIIFIAVPVTFKVTVDLMSLSRGTRILACFFQAVLTIFVVSCDLIVSLKERFTISYEGRTNGRLRSSWMFTLICFC